MKKELLLLTLGCLSQVAFSQNKPVFKGQDPIQGVSTETKPVQKQWKGIFPVGSVFFRNDFEGGRLNGITQVNDTLYSALITSENTPINGSPWYSFKVWSNTPKRIVLQLTYQQGSRHRYPPKLSHDGTIWTELNHSDSGESAPVSYSFPISVSRDTLWVAAQELTTSKHVQAWIKTLTKKPYIKSESFGKSRDGRALPLLRIGNLSSKKRIIITGRQHPPEVTGHLALKAFVETLAGDSELAKKFRSEYLIYVMPLLNPDGVDEGFWRHNSGGIDLNRDYDTFHQPESKAVRDFLIREIKQPGNQLVFGLDFHSTGDDIYYTVDPKLIETNREFIPTWLAHLKGRLPGYEPNVKPLYLGGPTYTAYSYFFKTYGAQSLVYEIGDRTPRPFIQEKSQVAAEELMKLLVTE
ncbi:MAG: M14 family metallopeptidase [Siphonobacter sp.]